MKFVSRLSATACFAALAAICLAADNPAAPPPAVKPLIQIEITPGNPTLRPTPPEGKNRVEQHADLLKQARKVRGKVDVLFFGDAMIQCWCTGENNEVWKKNYAPLKAFNLGMASNTIGMLLWRVNDGALEGMTPKVVVLHAGLHNVWTMRSTPRELVEGIATLVNAVHEKLPQAKILLVGITPSGRPGSVYRTTPRAVNKELAKFDNGDALRFLDVTQALVGDDGPISPELYDANTFNLVRKGYERWADAMNPLLGKMLGTQVPPASEPAPVAP